MKCDTDAHVHLENGPLTKEYVWKFVNAAKAKGIKHLQILDHTHRFFEFHDMYEQVYETDPKQKAWFEKKQVNSIKEYHQLIEELRKEDFGIDVTFGLEVCYTPETEEFLRNILSQYPCDFLVGSVHSVNGYLYDMDAFSRELLWNKHPAEKIYKQYFNNIKQAIKSDLFTQIGHPDVIKMYDYDPGYDLTTEYEEIAKLAIEHHVLLEENTGAHYRYHHKDVGLNPKFREVLKKYDVPTITASDAHYPEHVAMDFELLKTL